MMLSSFGSFGCDRLKGVIEFLIVSGCEEVSFALAMTALSQSGTLPSEGSRTTILLALSASLGERVASCELTGRAKLVVARPTTSTKADLAICIFAGYVFLRDMYKI